MAHGIDYRQNGPKDQAPLIFRRFDFEEFWPTFRVGGAMVGCRVLWQSSRAV